MELLLKLGDLGPAVTAELPGGRSHEQAPTPLTDTTPHLSDGQRSPATAARTGSATSPLPATRARARPLRRGPDIAALRRSRAHRQLPGGIAAARPAVTGRGGTQLWRAQRSRRARALIHPASGPLQRWLASCRRGARCQPRALALRSTRPSLHAGLPHRTALRRCQPATLLPTVVTPSPTTGGNHERDTSRTTHRDVRDGAQAVRRVGSTRGRDRARPAVCASWSRCAPRRSTAARSASTCTGRTRAPRARREERLYSLDAWRESPFYTDARAGRARAVPRRSP